MKGYFLAKLVIAAKKHIEEFSREAATNSSGILLEKGNDILFCKGAQSSDGNIKFKVINKINKGLIDYSELTDKLSSLGVIIQSRNYYLPKDRDSLSTIMSKYGDVSLGVIQSYRKPKDIAILVNGVMDLAKKPTPQKENKLDRVNY